MKKYKINDIVVFRKTQYSPDPGLYYIHNDFEYNDYYIKSLFGTQQYIAYEREIRYPTEEELVEELARQLKVELVNNYREIL